MQLFHVCFDDLIAPLAIEAEELVAEWDAGPSQDPKGWGRYLRCELYALVFPGDPPNLLFLLRRLNTDFDLSDPVGDELVIESEADLCLEKAGIQLDESLAEIEQRLLGKASECVQVVDRRNTNRNHEGADSDSVCEGERITTTQTAPPTRAFMVTSNGVPGLMFHTAYQGQPEHDEDFSLVNCHLGEFKFTVKQRPVIRALWEAWQRGGHGLSNQTICSITGDTAKHPRDVFKNHPAWGKLIVSAGVGRYRLNLPRPAAG